MPIGTPVIFGNGATSTGAKGRTRTIAGAVQIGGVWAVISSPLCRFSPFGDGRRFLLLGQARLVCPPFLRLVTDGASPWSASLARPPAISSFGDGRRFALVGQVGSSASHFFVW